MKKIFSHLLPALLLTTTIMKAQAWSETGGLNSLAANDQINSVCSDASGNYYCVGSCFNNNCL